MRLVSCAVLATALLAGCGKNKSKLDRDRSGDVDALWDLAPDGTELGVVAAPRAVGMVLRGFATVRGLMTQPDLAPAKAQLDELTKAMFGSEGATPEDAGFSGDKAFAMFATKDGVLGIMPVGDRDKFMIAKKGTRGSAEDTLESNKCRELKGHYVCATKVEMFDRLGKGSLRGKLANPGARGDAELFMSGVTLLGDTKGDLVLAAQLEPGQVGLWGRWNGTPSGLVAKLSGPLAPRPSLDGIAGFVTFDAAPLLGSLPEIPLAGGVTTTQLAAAMVGPITATIPAGAIDIQIKIPLKDAKPAQTIVDHCTDVGTLFELAEQQTPGACRIRLQGTNALELDIWVDGNDLRVGAKKGPMPVGKAGAVTAIGRELASQDWTAALWGRGTMLNLSGIKPSTQEVPDQIALGIHAMSLVNELGAAAKVEPTGVQFRVALRTVFANPPDVVATYVGVSGNDIVTGKATATGQTLASTAPSSPFAADFAAGQGGLMVPAAAIGLVTAVIVPAISRYIGGEEAGSADANTPPGPAMNNSDLATLLVRAYVEEAYPKWLADNKGKKCPAKIEELAKYFGDDPGIPILQDPWGHDLVMQCDDRGIVVLSVGEDGQLGTPDDVRSL